MTTTFLKNYWSAIFITIFNFILICFAVDFNLGLETTLSFNNHDEYAEINYLLYFLISTLALLFFNGVLLLLESIALFNTTLKLIATIIILFPLCALIFSIVMISTNAWFAYKQGSIYIPGIFLLISAMMVYRLLQIYPTSKGK